jgi:K+ transporter
VIATRAVITGAFSITRQAIQLGLPPRLRVIQTSAAAYGQIYLPRVNWLLMIATLSLAISFRHSSGLAAAYGIAVSATMLATTVLLSIAMREIWGWQLPAVIAIPVDPSNATYFVGHETIVPREDGKGLLRLVRITFWFLLQNMSDASDYFRLPREGC